MLHRVLARSRSRGEKGGKGDSPTHDRSQVRYREKDLARAIALPFRKQRARLMLGRLRWKLIHLRLNRRNLGSRSRLKELGQVQRQRRLQPQRPSQRERRAKSAQASRAESKETKRADPKVEVKKEKGSGDDAPGDSRGSAEKQKRERKSRWAPEVPAKESTKREASKRPDDVDSRPGAAAREASGDDLHSALGRSSAKDGGAGCCEPGGRSLQDATGCFDGGCFPGDVLQQGARQTG